MRSLIIILILLTPLMVEATYDQEKSGSESQASAHSQAASVSGSQSVAKSESVASNSADNSSSNTSSVSDQSSSVTNLVNRWKTVANSAAPVSVGECSQAISGQNEDGGFAVGGMAQECKDDRILRRLQEDMKRHWDNAASYHKQAQACPEGAQRDKLHALAYQEIAELELANAKYNRIQDETIEAADDTRQPAKWADIAIAVLKIGVTVGLAIYGIGFIPI